MTENKRNYGIDLLRIISMFFIIILHSLGRGGLLENTLNNSIQYKTVWFMEICAYCAVNVFALISGYVSYTDEDKKVKISNYVNLWLQVVFYGIVVTFVFNIIDPSIVSIKDYLITIFPITNGLYWYFTAYTGLFILMPFLNKIIRSCSEQDLKKLFIIIIIFFSIFDRVANVFVLADGYSFIWITLLYILGAIIKKCNIGNNLNKKSIFFGIFISYLITYLWKIYGVEFKIFNIMVTKNLFVSYISPTILIVSILYVVGFSKIKTNNFNKNIIKFLSSSAFSIYILNNHRYVWNYVMKDLFVKISNHEVLEIIISVIGFSCLFVVVSILIDKIRILLFKKCNLNKLSIRTSGLLNKALTKLSTLI